MLTDVKVLSSAPENRETPLSEAQSWVTPNRWFFVRSHFDTPEVDIDAWRLHICGCVHTPRSLTWSDISSLPRRSVFSTMECAGNGRSFLEPRVEGVQWSAGAVGHAEWSGVPLCRILSHSDLKPEAIELVFEGADRGLEKGVDEPIPFARSLPIAKALHEDTLLVTHMNGEPLAPSHGYPLRLIVPGWYGVASVKWLHRIEAVAQPFEGYFQSVKYTIERSTGHGTRVEAVGPMPVKSEIVRPAEGDVCGLGLNRITGLSWAGTSAIAAVEVSTDGGITWRAAELSGPTAPYSWTMWEYGWQVDTPGEYTILARAISAAGEVQPVRHDRLRGGYLINFSRPLRCIVDATKRSDDAIGDADVLRRELSEISEQRFGRPLDAEIEFASGAGI